MLALNKSAIGNTTRPENLMPDAICSWVLTFFTKAKQAGTLEEIYQLMDAYLKHKADRLLFDLAPLIAEK